MKTTLATFTILAAFAVAPFASQAADKEVQNPRSAHACVCHKSKQVALFVSGRGISDHTAPATQTVFQVGQGIGVTFFTGNK